MKRILDRSFRYVPSVETDIRVTFRRERNRLKKLATEREQNQAEAKTKTILLDCIRKSGGRDPK